jgi:hypothetical protein
MKQLIISNLSGTAATTLADLTGVTAKLGAIYLPDRTGNNVVNAFPGDMKASEPFQIIYKKSTGQVMTSPVLTLDSIVKAEYMGYSAGTKQKWTIVPELPAAQQRGMEWIVKVIDTTGGNLSVEGKAYTVIHTGTDYTAETLVDAFVTAINKSNFGFTADNVADDLVIEVDSPNEHVSISVDGEMEQASITLTTQNIPSSGTTVAMKALEAECESYSEGITNKVQYPVVRPESEVTAGNYNMHLFVFDAAYNNKDGMEPKRAHRLKLYVAHTTALNPLGALIFDEL